MFPLAFGLIFYAFNFLVSKMTKGHWNNPEKNVDTFVWWRRIPQLCGKLYISWIPCYSQFWVLWNILTMLQDMKSIVPITRGEIYGWCSNMMTSFMDLPGIGEDIVEHLVQLLGLDVQEAVLVLDVVRFQVLLHFLLMSIKNKHFLHCF